MRDAAVIDMGSNSVRLLLVQAGRTEQFLETTRLGKGVEARRLQKEPMERTVQAVERFCALARGRGIERVYAFATSAVRDAENRGELLALLRERCGLAVDVLSGEEEADLAYLGAADGARALVLDIGGGSTELVFGEGTVRQAVSLQAGAVRLRERFGQDRDGAQAFLDERFAAQRAAFAGAQGAPLLGIGGTITTLAAMEQRLDVYCEEKINGFVLRAQDVRAWVDRLWDLPAPARAFPGLEPSRADIIAHGALILDRALAAFAREQVRASTADNLLGYLRLAQRRETEEGNPR